jgi:hypothetical protein
MVASMGTGGAQKTYGRGLIRMLPAC